MISEKHLNHFQKSSGLFYRKSASTLTRRMEAALKIFIVFMPASGAAAPAHKEQSLLFSSPESRT